MRFGLVSVGVGFVVLGGFGLVLWRPQVWFWLRGWVVLIGNSVFSGFE